MTRTQKIPAKDLKQPEFFYHYWMEESSGGFHKPHIGIRANNDFSHDCLVLRWQISPKNDAAGTSTHILGAYAMYATLDMDYCRLSSGSQAFAKLVKSLNGATSIKATIRALRHLGYRRFVYANDFKWTPRKYRTRQAEYLKAIDLVAA